MSIDLAQPNETDQKFIRIALGLGKRGQGQTWPNPAVGCILVKDNIIVGRGFTQSQGKPHAEVVALNQAGTKARGATAYITLEPCCFEGKTPPCTDAIVAAGIKRVCYSLVDPDPRVAGKGDDILRNNGIAVASPCMEDLAKYDHQGFILSRTEGRPKITLKLAGSFDGKVATRTGDSKWITSQQARHRVHLMRAKNDAVLIGKGTAEIDDPMLNPRGLGINHKPVRIVMDTNLTLSLDSKLAQTSAKIPTWICHRTGLDIQKMEQWNSRKVKLIPCNTTENGYLDPRDVAKRIGAFGVTRVFCEGGPKLAASLFACNLVDEFISFFAGKALGSESLSSVGPLDLDLVKMAPNFRLMKLYRIGRDAVCHWVPDSS
ncbi:MAG: bifunctional diaminohydroxyphosphoribosylaminopyrimidine deaminase/5-amino-6-(5-phosphoribosylamino)uracil reductase RibD [Rhodobacteraceae bacterium]|nr:bifunctional diaminohydroxyphosphoribosylaminopyrimidine deaminase/5-amino-6-(5-phosphoribosylamino)uracil reductase RibD [Paracoccaceae bacterium]